MKNHDPVSKQKLESLTACLQSESWEDAAGHLCDLLDFCRLRAVSSDGRVYVNLQAFVAYYGKHPKPESCEVS